MPMHYTAIFTAVKFDNFQMKNCNSFLISVQNLDSGHLLELPRYKSVNPSFSIYCVFGRI